VRFDMVKIVMRMVGNCIVVIEPPLDVLCPGGGQVIICRRSARENLYGESMRQ